MSLGSQNDHRNVLVLCITCVLKKWKNVKEKFIKTLFSISGIEKPRQIEALREVVNRCK